MFKIYVFLLISHFFIYTKKASTKGGDFCERILIVRERASACSAISWRTSFLLCPLVAQKIVRKAEKKYVAYIHVLFDHCEELYRSSSSIVSSTVLFVNNLYRIN